MGGNMEDTPMIDLISQVEKSSRQRFAHQLRELMPSIRDYLASVRNLPYTLHDWRHSQKVDQLCVHLVPDKILRAMTPLELFLLTLALWLHDGGMVPDREDETDEDIREGHPTRIRRRIRGEGLPFLAGLDPHVREVLGRICRSHGLDSLHDEELVPPTTFVGEDVRLRFLCAILRLCDICDVSFERTPWYIYKNFVFRPNSLRHWETNLLIHGLKATHGKKTTRFCLEAEYTSEQEREYISKAIETIETEIAILKDVFKSNGWCVETEIEQAVREKDPEDETLITVLPPNIYRLLIDHIYESRRVYIRELIQNAIDSCKIRRKWCEQQGTAYEPIIHVCVYPETEARRDGPFLLKVYDNGMGMNQADVKSFLLQIGTGIMLSEEVAEILSSGESPEHLIAEFGIGFLSCFPVAENISIKTKKEGFMGLKIDFPDFSQEPSRVSERHVHISRETSLTEPGTTVVLYLNQEGKRHDIHKAVTKYCRNLRFPLCYQESEFDKHPDVWAVHNKHASCTRIQKRFLGEDAPHKVRFGFDERSQIEGVIGFFPDRTENTFYVCQEGIYIQDRPDLVRPGFTGIQGEVNLKAGNITLTAPRNHIVRNRKYETLKRKLDRHFLELLEILPKDSPIRPYSERPDRRVAILNGRHQSLRKNHDELKKFFLAVEEGIVVTRGAEEDESALKEIREDAERGQRKEVYQVVDHVETMAFIPLKPVDGCELHLVPMLAKIKAKVLAERGDVVFRSQILSPREEEFYQDRFLRRQFYRDYFESFGVELIQLEPSDWGDLIPKDKKLPEQLASLARDLLKTTDLQFMNRDIDLRCLLERSQRLLNLGHPAVREILQLFHRLEENGGKLEIMDRNLLRVYFLLVTFSFSDSIHELEQYLRELGRKGAK